MKIENALGDERGERPASGHNKTPTRYQVAVPGASTPNRMKR